MNRPMLPLLAFAVMIAVCGFTAENSAAAKSRQAAEAGDAKAQYELGRRYAYGIGVPEDHKQSVHWFRKAAEQNYAPAQFYLGIWYRDGLTERGTGAVVVKKDPESAAQLFGKALPVIRKDAEAGVAESQYLLGLYYHGATGEKEDRKLAFDWYLKAAERGNADGQVAVGKCYEEGRGAERNPEKAVAWYRKAAEGGDLWAQVVLGDCYRFGRGVEKDNEQATAWLSKAAAQNYAPALKALKSMERDAAKK